MGSVNIVTFVHRMSSAYESFCRPLCRDLQIHQTAFDIIMFLANNPQHNTARDISQYRWIKPNLVSFTVDKLVNEGYLQRHPVPDDRRKVRLSCTEKAAPIIEQGRHLQDQFTQALIEGMNPQEVQQFKGYMEIIEGNIEAMLKEN